MSVGMKRKQHNVETYTKDANFEEGGSVGGAVVKRRAEMEIRWKLIEKQLPGDVQI